MATVKSLRIMLYADHTKLSKGLEGAKKKVKNAAREMAKALALGFASRELGRSIVSGIREAIKMEQFSVDIAVLSGSGSKLFKELRDEALDSPFPIEDWMMAGKRLLGAQVPMERVTNILRMLGEMSAGTGSRMSELGLVFTQVWAKGRLQGEEMLQFMERNVSLQKALQKVLGVTKQEYQQLQEAGLITPEHVIQAMEEMTKKGGLFGGMMAAKMKTLGGRVQKMKTSWDILISEVGARLLPALRVAAGLITVIMNDTGFIRGFFAVLVVMANLLIATLIGIYGVFQLIDTITGGIFSWVVGIAAGWALIGMTVFLVNKGIVAITGGTTLFALASTGVLGIWNAIRAAVTSATGGLNLLVAALVTALVALFWYFSSGWLSDVSDDFKKITEEAKEIRDAMNEARGGGGGTAKLLMFGTAELANFNAKQKAREITLAEQQVAELRMIRENTAKEQEKEFKRTQKARAMNRGKVFTP